MATMKKAKKVVVAKELAEISKLFGNREVVVEDKKVEDGQFTCRAAFKGVSSQLFGATGKSDTVEYARQLAKTNLVGVFAGSMLHHKLLKEYKASKTVKNRQVFEVAKPIFEYAEAVLKRPKYSFMCDESRTFAPVSSPEQSELIRSARKDIWNYAKDVFKVVDESREDISNTSNGSNDLLLQPPPPPPPLPNPETNLKRKIVNSEPSTSKTKEEEEPTNKKMKVVIQIDDDDDDETNNVSTVRSSSESSDDGEIVFEKATLANAVQSPNNKKVAGSSSSIPIYVDDVDPKYSESDLLGVTSYSMAKMEKRRIREYKRNFGDHFNIFDEAIWQHYKANGQDDNIYNWKMEVRMELLNVARKVYPGNDVNMFAVGSTVNGCGSYNSDMDLCLVLYNHDGQITEGQDFAKRTLNKLWLELRRRRDVKKCEFIRHAVVPIIKLEMGSPNELEVDINLNNIAGVYNSHLMHYYSRVDDRFAALCLIVKHWAINAGINDSLNGTFNSYSLILLVLHYLQCGVVPCVLPNLQYLYPNRFGSQSELSDLDLFGVFSPPLPQRILNEQTVGELLVGFFRYYAHFDFNLHAISIRKGAVFPRNQLVNDTVKFGLYIEEPFDGKNTARCVRRDLMHVVTGAFKHASEAFNERKPNLDDINVTV